MDNKSYDVIIIGAGSIGVPTAFFLSLNKLKVLIVDKNVSVGQSSNKSAIGGIRATHSDPAKISLGLSSISVFSTWKEIYGDDIEWFQGGYLFTAYQEKDEKALKNLLKVQIGMGLNINWINRDDLLEIAPHLNTDNLIGGTFSPGDGNASPLLAIHSFYNQSLKLGADYFFNSTVNHLLTSKNKIMGISTNRGDFYAPIVINAAGAWASKIGALAGIHIPVTPDSHEAGITEPVKRFLTPMIVDIRPFGKSANFYFYQHFTGQVLFCLTPSPNIWGFDIRETSQFLPLVSQRIIDVMPSLMNLRIRRTWRGLYPMTPDGFPIIGFTPQLEGFFLAVGMCGQGFMFGPGVGKLISRIFLHTTDDKDQEILTLLSPSRKFINDEKLK